jgi:prophage antirepressor-like protein
MEKNLCQVDQSDQSKLADQSQKSQQSDQLVQLNMIKNNIFNKNIKYNNADIYVIKVDQQIYFKGRDVCTILGYIDTDKAIRNHVDDDDKIKNLSRHFSGIENNVSHRAIFINESGLYSLIMGSKKPQAKQFKRWVTKDVLPSLRKYGIYSINTDQKQYKSFYDDNMLVNYHEKNVLYIGYIGVHNDEPLFKFGKSINISRRDIEEHQKYYDSFELVYLRVCDNKDKVENIFKAELKAKKVHRPIRVKNKIEYELFGVNNMFSLETAKNIMDVLIDTCKLSIINEYETKRLLENNHNKDEHIRLLKSNMKDKDDIISLLRENKLTSNIKDKAEFMSLKKSNFELIKLLSSITTDKNDISLQKDKCERMRYEMNNSYREKKSNNNEKNNNIENLEITIVELEEQLEEEINKNIANAKSIKQRDKMIKELKSGEKPTNVSDSIYKNPDNVRINIKKKQNSFFVNEYYNKYINKVDDTTQILKWVNLVHNFKEYYYRSYSGMMLPVELIKDIFVWKLEGELKKHRKNGGRIYGWRGYKLKHL